MHDISDSTFYLARVLSSAYVGAALCGLVFALYAYTQMRRHNLEAKKADQAMSVMGFSGMGIGALAGAAFGYFDVKNFLSLQS